jgi:xanthine dehydrogenase accessory factor
VQTSVNARPAVIVIGCDEVGSAIAWTLHRAGAAVVLIDAADPPWPRRGMSYTDAWYVGGATLEDVDACFCSSVRSVPAVLARGDLLAATTWSWEAVASALRAIAVVETRPGLRSAVGKSRPRVLDGVLAVGVRTTKVSEWHADVVIAGPRGSCSAEPSATDAGAAPMRESDVNGEASDPRVTYRIETPNAGRFRTRCEIGERVDAGDLVGEVGGFTAAAPAAGVLRGLTARGARVGVGQTVVELDTACEPMHCFGIGSEARAIAHRVSAAIRRWRKSQMAPSNPGKVASDAAPAASTSFVASSL